ncbi:MAG: RNA polymerase sigma factor [Nannocystales bacterium]
MGAALFFTALAAAGLAACFPLGLVAPLLNGLRLVRAAAALRSQTRAAGDVAQHRGCAHLPPHLSAAQRLFASDTRALLSELEHAQAHAHRFSDTPRGGWWRQLIASQSGSVYVSSIGIAGEVWRWLRQAEELLDDPSEPAGPELEPATTAVRAMLFDTRPWSERFEALVALVGRVDAGLRTQAAGSYRDKLPVPALPKPDRRSEPPQSTEERTRLREYEQALEDNKRAIRAIVRRFAAPAEQADLTQEIRLALWKALPAHRGDCSVRSYVLRIARYRAITFRERKVVLEPESVWIDDAPEPGELLDQARRRRALANAIEQLPVRLRLALEMRLAGSSYREIGERLAISEKNASVRVSRARQALKRDFCTDS